MSVFEQYLAVLAPLALATWGSGVVMRASDLAAVAVGVVVGISWSVVGVGSVVADAGLLCTLAVVLALRPTSVFMALGAGVAAVQWAVTLASAGLPLWLGGTLALTVMAMAVAQGRRSQPARSVGLRQSASLLIVFLGLIVALAPRWSDAFQTAAALNSGSMGAEPPALVWAGILCVVALFAGAAAGGRRRALRTRTS